MLKTPILLVTFNRPEHTRRVLEVILKQEPLAVWVLGKHRVGHRQHRDVVGPVKDHGRAYPHRGANTTNNGAVAH